MKAMAHSVKADLRELRHFGLLLGVLFAVVFAGIPFLRHHSLRIWPWAVAAALWLPALFAPTALGYPYRGWTTLGRAMGWVNTRVILSLLYIIAIVPIGFLMRLLGRDPMRREIDPAVASYRIRSRRRSANHLERPF
jgi:fatty acid desaturase